MRYQKFKCECPTCLAFTRKYDFHWPLTYGSDGFATKFWRNPNGPCGICGDDRSHEHVTFLPEVVASFFNTTKVCDTCRSWIHGLVQRWELCWGSSPDWALKWAMAEMILESYKFHFSSAFGHDRNFKEKTCCKIDHGVQ